MTDCLWHPVCYRPQWTKEGGGGLDTQVSSRIRKVLWRHLLPRDSSFGPVRGKGSRRVSVLSVFISAVISADTLGANRYAGVKIREGGFAHESPVV